MRTLLVRYVVPLVVGILGLFVGVGILHVWNDHQTLHAVVTYINAQEAAKNGPK